MRKIKIFIGSSIDDLAYERRDLVSFITELNNKYIDRGIYIEPYICEEKSNEMRPEGSQKVHDDYIENDADAMIFMFFKKAGKYTLRELQIAKDTLTSKEKKPHIFIYFKTINNEVVDSIEIKAAIDKIAGEYAHYYKKFSEADTIKLELLQYLSDILSENSLTIKGGKVYIGDIEANEIDLSNVFAFQNNTELTILKNELNELEKQIQVCVEEKNWIKLAELSTKHQEKQTKYSDLETEILKMLQQLFKCLHEEKVNPIRLKALLLLEEGKHQEALLLLPLNEIRAKSVALVEKKAMQDEIIKQEANDILQDGIARLHVLDFDINNENSYMEIEKTYDSILDIAIIAGKSHVLMEYIMLLESRGDVKKALMVTKLLEENFNLFDDIDLYTKYDTYNLLSDFSENETEQQRYSNLAKESLITHMESLDKNDWENYLDSCTRLCELFLSPEELIPILEQAVVIAEAHTDTHDIGDTFHFLCEFLGLLYKDDLGDNESAEKYLNKALEVADKETVNANLSEVFDVFLKITKKENVDYNVPENIILWRSKITETYESLYEINADKYIEEYVISLQVYFVILFVDKRYKESMDIIYKATNLSGEGEIYEKIKRFKAGLSKI